MQPGSDARDSERTLDDLWADVVGQPDLVSALRAAAVSPVQAYLIVGPEGSGKRAAATAFAAELLVGAAGTEPGSPEASRIVHLADTGVHPCMSIVERDGPAISADQARDVVRRAALAPPEGDLQVFVLDEFHLVRDAAPILLKTIEEPPPTTIFVVLAEDVPEELVTIASRCVQLHASAVPASAIEERLVAEGVTSELAAEASRSAGGSLRRARLLSCDSELVARRSAWAEAPTRLDGSGSAACNVADELLEGIDSVLEPLGETHQAEMEAFDDMAERSGVARKGDRSRMEARHKREARRLRTDELRAGLATLVGHYRDAVGDADAVAAERFTDAAGAVQSLTDSLQFNPNESLALRALLLRLPPDAA